MSRPARTLRRPSGTRHERETILVVTEGQTEKGYIEGLKQHLRSSATPQVTATKVVNGKGEPDRVMRTAQARSKDADFDEVWLLLDVDEHARLLPVVEQARRLGFFAAVSNPCFEVWVVWHFEDVRQEADRGDVQRTARGHGVDKSLPANFPYDLRVEAVNRADRRFVGINCVGPNPSTGFPRLLDRICGTDSAPAKCD